MNTNSKIGEIIYEIETSNSKGQELLNLTNEMYAKMKAIEYVENQLEINNKIKQSITPKETNNQLEETIVTFRPIMINF